VIPANPYPTGIIEKFFILDNVVFAPRIPGQIERAVRCCKYIGDVLLDRRHAKDGSILLSWLARKFDSRGELTDWLPMRCAAEARAFLVSKKPI
jgi:hypothetical protein